MKVARIRLGSGREWMGGRVNAGGQPLHDAGSSGHQPWGPCGVGRFSGSGYASSPIKTVLGVLQIRDVLLLYCKKIPASSDQMRPGPAAQDQNGDLADGTYGAPREDTCASPHFSTLPRYPGYCATLGLELHTGHSLPAQSQLLILKQCHCHQLALIRTWSNQFLELTAETCNKIPPSSLTAWQHWQDRRLAAL